MGYLKWCCLYCCSNYLIIKDLLLAAIKDLMFKKAIINGINHYFNLWSNGYVTRDDAWITIPYSLSLIILQ